MQTVNDYNMEWEINDSEGVRSGKGVFNGDIGYITRIDRTENLAEILFDDGRRAVYTSADMPDLTLAYAVTVHKSQGSEFDALVVAVTNGPPTILNRNLLYTAVTRAKKTVVLVCSKRMLGMMVKNNYIEERATMLKAFLKEEKQKRSALYL